MSLTGLVTPVQQKRTGELGWDGGWAGRWTLVLFNPHPFQGSVPRLHILTPHPHLTSTPTTSLHSHSQSSYHFPRIPDISISITDSLSLSSKDKRCCQRSPFKSFELRHPACDLFFLFTPVQASHIAPDALDAHITPILFLIPSALHLATPTSLIPSFLSHLVQDDNPPTDVTRLQRLHCSVPGILCEKRRHCKSQTSFQLLLDESSSAKGLSQHKTRRIAHVHTPALSGPQTHLSALPSGLPVSLLLESALDVDAPITHLHGRSNTRLIPSFQDSRTSSAIELAKPKA